MIHCQPYPEMLGAGLDHIHIFRTNIRPEDIEKLNGIFKQETRVDSWSVDTEDCDAVLRVVSYMLMEAEIQASMTKYGFFCEPLS